MAPYQLFTENNDEPPEAHKWGFREDMMFFYEQGATEELFYMSIEEEIVAAGIAEYVANHTLSHAQVSCYVACI